MHIGTTLTEVFAYDVLIFRLNYKSKTPPDQGVFYYQKYELQRKIMSELRNILWMAEELDFKIAPDNKQQAEAEMRAFLENAAGSELVHSIYQP
jgi:hypothetical protein